MKTNGNRSGFSMVEVLVASSIMVVIVLMLGLLFQQTGLAWRTGAQRANNYMEVRALVGSLQRDAAAAVDQSCISPDLRSILGGDQNFNSFPLSFYTLSGTGYQGDDPDNTPLRALRYISYSQDGQRTEKTLMANGSTYAPSAVNVRKVFSTSKVEAKISDVEPEYPSGGNKYLPLSVRMRITVETGGKSYDIGAESAGPDGKFGSTLSDPNGKDDIRTWVD